VPVLFVNQTQKKPRVWLWVSQKTCCENEKQMILDLDLGLERTVHVTVLPRQVAALGAAAVDRSGN
jgi:hypothetical protein